MPLWENVGGTPRKITKLWENVGGTRTQIISLKQNVGGVFQELLAQTQLNILTSGTLILDWIAFGNANITSQSGGLVNVQIASGSSTDANNLTRISSATFYAQKGTQITFTIGNCTPSGPVLAYLVDDSNGSSRTIGVTGNTITITATGYYHLVITGAGVVQGSYTTTTISNAKFTFTGGIAYLSKSTSIYTARWFVRDGAFNATITSQSGGELTGTLYNGEINFEYGDYGIYSNEFYITENSRLTMVSTMSPSGPFGAHLVNSSGTVVATLQNSSDIVISSGGYYHIALSGCGVSGSASGPNSTIGTFTVKFTIA